MYGSLFHKETDSYNTHKEKEMHFQAFLSLSYHYFVTQTVMNGGNPNMQQTLQTC